MLGVSALLKVDQGFFHGLYGRAEESKGIGCDFKAKFLESSGRQKRGLTILDHVGHAGGFNLGAEEGHLFFAPGSLKKNNVSTEGGKVTATL